MSFSSLKLNVWTGPTGEARVYINSAFVERANIWRYADGAYLYASDKGTILWDSKRPDASSSTGVACCKLIKELGLENAQFDELLRRISLCQTKGGNFSMTQYDKRQAANNWQPEFDASKRTVRRAPRKDQQASRDFDLEM